MNVEVDMSSEVSMAVEYSMTTIEQELEDTEQSIRRMQRELNELVAKLPKLERKLAAINEVQNLLS